MIKFETIGGYLIESGYNSFVGEYKSYMNMKTYTIEWEWTLKTGYIKKNKQVIKIKDRKSTRLNSSHH